MKGMLALMGLIVFLIAGSVNLDQRKSFHKLQHQDEPLLLKSKSLQLLEYRQI
ncbi:hypothetical protein ACFL1H_03090 [Nanoarchaeota archaeon]